MINLKILTTLMSATIITGCVSTTQMGYGSDRKQLFISSGNFALKQAEKKTKKTIESSERSYHSPLESRVVNIINTLAPYANQYIVDGRKVDWDLLLHNKKGAPAGILANGTIVMQRDFVSDKALSNDEALAYIIAHEMSHVIRQHHREREAWAYIVKPTLLATAYFSTGALALAAGITYDIPLFNKKLEKEADLLGLEIISKAGFDPKKAVNVYSDYTNTFRSNHPISSRLPSIIQPHPSFKSRTKYSHKHLDHVLPIYEVSKEQPKLNNPNRIKPNFNPNDVIIVEPTRPISHNDNALQSNNH